MTPDGNVRHSANAESKGSNSMRTRQHKNVGVKCLLLFVLHFNTGRCSAWQFLLLSLFVVVFPPRHWTIAKRKIFCRVNAQFPSS